MDKKIVVTGVGCINALGQTIEQTYENIKNNVTGIQSIGLFEELNLSYKHAAKIAPFNVRQLVQDRKLLKLISSDDAMGLYVADQAIKDSKINEYRSSLHDNELKNYNHRTGIFVGNIGGAVSQEHELLPLLSEAKSWQEYGDKLSSTIQPMWILRTLVNNVLAHVGIRHQLLGANQNIVNHAISSIQALQEAYYAILNNTIDRALVIGFSSLVEPEIQQHWGSQNLLRSAPLNMFDNNDGSVLGEGAGAVLIETQASAVERQAEIYTELLSFGNAVDAKGLLGLDEEGKGLFSAVKQCLDEKNITTNDVGFISTHADGRLTSDTSEALVYRELFPNALFTGYKWALGHTLAASGLLEFIITAYSLKQQKLLASRVTENSCQYAQDFNYINLHSDYDYSKPALLISRGFGGMNACVAFK